MLAYDLKLWVRRRAWKKGTPQKMGWPCCNNIKPLGQVSTLDASFVGSLRREEEGSHLLLSITWPRASCSELGRRSPASDQFELCSHFSWGGHSEPRSARRWRASRRGWTCSAKGGHVGGRAHLGQLFMRRSVAPLCRSLHQLAISLHVKFDSLILLRSGSGMAGYCFFSRSSLHRLLGKRLSWSCCGARMGVFPNFLWSWEFSLPNSWVLGLANGQSTVLCHQASPLMWWVGEDMCGSCLVFLCCRWCFRLGGVCCLFVSWLVLLCTPNLHERVQCAQVEQAKET